jgi:hypothetical protein
MRTALIAALIVSAAPAAALADETFRHPAIATQPTAPAGYDYASKFYPHPAWLHLLAQAPQEMGQHPAVLVFNRQQREQREQLRQQREISAQDLIARASTAPDATAGQ